MPLHDPRNAAVKPLPAIIRHCFNLNQVDRRIGTVVQSVKNAGIEKETIMIISARKGMRVNHRTKLRMFITYDTCNTACIFGIKNHRHGAVNQSYLYTGRPFLIHHYLY